MGIEIGLYAESVRWEQKGMLPPGAGPRALVTARNDWAAASVILLADESLILSFGSGEAFTPLGAWKTLRFALDCPLPGGSICPVAAVPDDMGHMRAEVVLKQDFVELPAEQAGQLFVHIPVGPDVDAGEYPGTVKVYIHDTLGDETLLQELAFTVEVHDVLLADPVKRQHHLDLWQHVSNIAYQGETPRFGEEHFDLLQSYVDSLANLGQKAISVIASEAPWSGQGLYRRSQDLDMANLFEYNLVKIFRDGDAYTYDYSVMDRYIEMCMAAGIRDEIEVFGLINIWQAPEYGYGSPSDYPDGVRIRYLDRKSGVYRYMRCQAEVEGYMSALEQHFCDKGWLDIVRVVADEPGDVEAFKRSLTAIRRAMPRSRMKAAINHTEFVEEFAQVIDDYVPFITIVSSKLDTLQRLRSLIKGRLMWYLCCGPDQPNTFIESPLIESRLMGIITAYLQYDGFLRWSYTCWPRNPRVKPQMNYPGWKAGDFGFVYPAKDGKALTSLRYWQLKRGLDDDELIRRVRGGCADGENVLKAYFERIFCQLDARQWVFTGGEDARFYSVKPEDYDAARRLLLIALEG